MARYREVVHATYNTSLDVGAAQTAVIAAKASNAAAWRRFKEIQEELLLYAADERAEVVTGFKEAAAAP